MIMTHYCNNNNNNNNRNRMLLLLPNRIRKLLFLLYLVVFMTQQRLAAFFEKHNTYDNNNNNHDGCKNVVLVGIEAFHITTVNTKRKTTIRTTSIRNIPTTQQQQQQTNRRFSKMSTIKSSTNQHVEFEFQSSSQQQMKKNTVVAKRNTYKTTSIQQQQQQQQPEEVEGPLWEIYVDQSKASLDRGGSATLDAFMGLAPRDLVVVKTAVFLSSSSSPVTSTTSPNGNNNNNNNNKNSKSSKGPCIRCIALKTNNDNNSSSSSNDKAGGLNQQQRSRRNNNINSFDVGNVDSVDKVYRVLTKYMQIPNISMKACECLKWKYKGNGYLEAGKIDLAIDSYDKALETNVPDQEGIILLMKATAYLQRAALHRIELKTIVNELATMVPNTDVYQQLYQYGMNTNDDDNDNEMDDNNNDTVNGIESSLSSSSPYRAAIANAIFRRVVRDTSTHEKQFRQTQYQHGLYQYSLLQAAQDSLRATQLLEYYSPCWQRAGEILAELWKVQQSIQYYVRCMELDTTLQGTIEPIIERLYKRQELLNDARQYGWSEDTLRLALDVAR